MQKIDFETNTKYGVFKSSMNVNDNATSEEIEQVKQNLIDAWISMIENPPVIEESNFEEIEVISEVNGIKTVSVKTPEGDING